MNCRDVIERMGKDFPEEYALEWDNVGLLAGRQKKEVERIYIALDAQEAIVEAAVESKADMLITHHPLIFSPVKQITDEDFIQRRIMKLLQNDISYYVAHTNYDVLKMGELAGEIFGLVNSQVLEMVTDEMGIGRVADLPQEISLKECCRQVRERFGLGPVRLFGEPEQRIKRVAISPGSGKSMIEAALAAGADVLITGDIGHHDGIDGLARGLNVIDAGHYGLEYIFMDDMERYIKRSFPNIQVKKAETVHPFVTL